MKVIGTKHHDVLVGSPAPFSDVIRGKGGDDVILGNGGDDKLFGGRGEDTFIFSLANAPNGIAKIGDFKPGRDTIIITPDGPGPHTLPIYDETTGVVSALIDQDFQPIIRLEKGLSVTPGFDLILSF